MRRLAQVALVLMLVAACRRGETARTSLSDSTTGPLVQPGNTAGAAALELWQLRSGVSLADWKRARPDEPVTGSDTSSVAHALGDWCAGAQRQITVGQRVVTRSAFFYPPPPTADLALPDSVPDLVARCELGLVWVRAELPDTAAARAFSDSLGTQLRAAFGPTRTGPVHFWGSAMWSRVAAYRRGDVSVVSGVRAPAPRDSAGRQAVAFAFALLPVSGLSIEGVDAPPAWAPVDTFPLDSAFRIAAADTAIANPVRALLRSSGSRPGDTRVGGDLIIPLQRWIARTAVLPPPRRAAALYIADQVLDRTLCDYHLCELADRNSRAPLEGVGARFTRSALGGAWVYQHSWLDQARLLDRDSPLGQRLFLAQLVNGFDFSGVCAAGPEGFRRVIVNGERYLARLPASPIAAEVHFEVAEAWRDIVALAHGAGDIYADSSRYGEEAGNAAVRSLAHYRAAIAAGPHRDVARAAWQRAWWMKAGLVPRDVRYYCVYD